MLLEAMVYPDRFKEVDPILTLLNLTCTKFRVLGLMPSSTPFNIVGQPCIWPTGHIWNQRKEKYRGFKAIEDIHTLSRGSKLNIQGIGLHLLSN